MKWGSDAGRAGPIAAGIVLGAVVVFAVVVLIVRTQVTDYTTQSGAMLPALKVGQSFSAAPLSGAPGLGDIVVFHPPAGAAPVTPDCGDPREGLGSKQPCGRSGAVAAPLTEVKRVIGLPGDRIALVDGDVVRNGVRKRAASVAGCNLSTCSFPTPITVPAGAYYLLGDNRGASDDSRFWGPVRRRWIIGVVVTCSILDVACSRAR